MNDRRVVCRTSTNSAIAAAVQVDVITDQTGDEVINGALGLQVTHRHYKLQCASFHSHLVLQQVGALDCEFEQSFGQKTRSHTLQNAASMTASRLPQRCRSADPSIASRTC